MGYGYYSQKKPTGLCVTYFHDYNNCPRCKSAMESNLQIGRSLKILAKKKRVSSDIIQPENSKLMYIQTFRYSKQYGQVKPAKKVLSKKTVKNTLFSPIKLLLNTPCKKLIFKKKNTIKVDAVKVESFPFDSKLRNLKGTQKLSRSTKEKSVVLGNVKSNSVKKSSRKSGDKGNGQY